jgi:hypothetical protein
VAQQRFSGIIHFMKMKVGLLTYLSQALITSSAIQRGGVEKYVDDTSVGSVKNHNQRPADLLGEAINDAKSGKPYHGHSDPR